MLRKGTNGLERGETDSHDFQEPHLLLDGHIFPLPIKGTGISSRPKAAAVFTGHGLESGV